MISKNNIILFIFFAVAVAYLAWLFFNIMQKSFCTTEHFTTAEEEKNGNYQARINVMKVFDTILHRNPTPEEITKYSQIGNEQDILVSVLADYKVVTSEDEERFESIAPPAQAPTMQAPPAQAPTMQAPPAQAPTMQAPPAQAPPAQAPPAQAPLAQAPTMQAPTMQAPPAQAPPAQAPTMQAQSCSDYVPITMNLPACIKQNDIKNAILALQALQPVLVS